MKMLMKGYFICVGFPINVDSSEDIVSLFVLPCLQNTPWGYIWFRSVRRSWYLRRKKTTVKQIHIYSYALLLFPMSFRFFKLSYIMRKFRDLKSWRFINLTIWKLENLEIWKVWKSTSYEQRRWIFGEYEVE